ncbi:GNAT family N-acetyltransferase [Enterobacter bugandensis]|nr:GNAT family N-acetyltransferase [Enterobacter bugandensis]
MKLHITTPDHMHFAFDTLEAIKNQCFPEATFFRLTDFQEQSPDGMVFRAVMAGDIPVGYYILCSNQKMNFLVHLAIDARYRSAGYGSEVMDHILQEYGSTPLTLLIEKPEAAAPPDDLKIRRLNFYMRKGFMLTGVTEIFAGNDYSLMSNYKEVDIAEYRKMIRRLNHQEP